MNQLTAQRRHTGLHLVKRVVHQQARQRVQSQTLREGSTGQVVVMLPRVWAVAETEAAPPEVEDAGLEPAMLAPGEIPAEKLAGDPAPAAEMPEPEIAFYRKYTEAMLRRYLRLSMSAGRVPSLLGRELFRGNVSSYRVGSFEDAVIFCFDIERCLDRLTASEKELIRRITLQHYSRGEVAAILGICKRQCIRRYDATLDRLTQILLDAKLLDPQKCCQ